MKKIYIVSGIFILSFFPAIGQLNVTPSVPPTTLVNLLLGTGVTPSNITTNGATPSSQGSFTCGGGCNIGFGDGIIITSGSAAVAANPNTGTGQGAAINNLGDAQLQPLTTNPVHDASTLEFDFFVASDSVRFNYIFASDEYSDFTNSPYNDVFGFFINGPGIAGIQNLARLPVSGIPVTINNVNNGGPVGHGTPLPGPLPISNPAYFRDNQAPVTITTAYDGLTTPLTAAATVCPCELYHIKLAVGDVQDQIYDSGVFLQGNSFSSVGQIEIFANGVPQANNANVYVCDGQSVTLSVLNGLAACSSSYTWATGATTQSIVVNQSNVGLTNGIFACTVTHPTNPGCFTFTTFVHVIYVIPTAIIAGINSICAGGNTILTANPGSAYLWNTGATTQAINVTTAGNYTVTVTTVNGGCTAVSAPFTVTVGGAVASIAGVLSLCNGAATILTANAGTGYLWSTGATTQNINVTSSGTYTVTVTQAGGCTASTSANVSVNPNPAPSIVGVTSVCQGQFASLDAGAGYSGYLWSNGATTQTIAPFVAGTYTVTVTDANGCTGADNIAVVVNALPNPVIAGNNNFCQGGNSVLNAGGGFASYLWSNGATTQTITVTTAANYMVTVANAAGCLASTSLNVFVNPNPIPVIAGITAFCQGSSTILDAGAGYNIYQWSNGAGTQTISPTTANTFTVTVTDINGCTGTTSIATVVNLNPVPNIIGNSAICQGTTTLFNAGVYASYLWSTGATTQNITQGVAGTYTVTVTDANGCTGTDNINLVVNALPTPSIAGVTTFCSGGNSILNAGAGYINYLWSNAATTQTINVTTSGNYAVTVTNANGCTASTSATIIVNALPTPVITGTAAICQGTTSILNGGNYVSYVWSTGVTTPTITVGTAGNYTVTVTDVNGCVNSSPAFALSINQLPSAVISQNSSICVGGSSSFKITFVGTAPFTYTYLPSGGSNITGTTSNNPVTINVSPGATTTYTLVNISDANCNGGVAGSATVTVNALPTPSIAGVTTFCSGGNSILNAGAGYINYLWSNAATT
ncbi:MAG: choice-of-anchor L domain-containing protein, partial [Bacteroidia bacterium]